MAEKKAKRAASDTSGPEAASGSDLITTTPPAWVFPTGSQVPSGAPIAESDAASAQAPLGAEPSCFASTSPTSIPGLEVSSSRGGFWRAGRQWSKAPQIVHLADLTDEQVDQITNEPLLSINYVDAAQP